jgi:uncharacterized protein YecE (DUF72 family)
MKKLRDPEPGIAKFFEREDHLERKLGPIIFQLPPWWEANAERLDHFLSVLPNGNRYSFELRNPTWNTPETLGILRRHNAAYCILEIAGQCPVSKSPLTSRISVSTGPTPTLIRAATRTLPLRKERNAFDSGGPN